MLGITIVFLISLAVRLSFFGIYLWFAGPFFRGNVALLTSARTDRSALTEFVESMRIFFGDSIVSIRPWTLLISSSVLVCVVDSISAVQVSHSQSKMKTRWLRVLSPLCLIHCAVGSVAPLEHFAFFLFMRMSGCERRYRLARFFASCLIVALLGVDRVALIVPCIFFLIVDNQRSEKESDVAEEAAVVTLALSTVIVLYSSTLQPSSILRHTPPDVGVSWYVWQLMIPYFDAPYAALSALTPIVLVVPVAMRSLGCTAFPYSSRRFASLFSIAAAILLGKSLTISDIEILVHLTATFCPDIFASMKAKCELLVLSLLVCFPLQQAFYRGWLTTRVANPNWLFFVSLSLFCTVVNTVATFVRMGLAIGEDHPIEAVTNE